MTGTAGSYFVSLKDNLDLSTSGWLMFQVIGAMCEFERALTQERVQAGLSVHCIRLVDKSRRAHMARIVAQLRKHIRTEFFTFQEGNHVTAIEKVCPELIEVLRTRQPAAAAKLPSPNLGQL